MLPQAPTLTMEGGRLKRSLQLPPGRDFETVPEPVWRALYHWYGANLSLPRPVSENNKPTQQLKNLTIPVVLIGRETLYQQSKSLYPSMETIS